MGFHKSSRDIQLKNRHILTAYCQRPSGEAKYSELDLDQILGAGNGKFKWSAKDFSKSAANVDLEMEGPSPPQPILYAELDDGNGGHNKEKVNLADCIKNEDGHLSYMQCF